MVKVRVSRPLRISRFRSMLSLIAIAMTCSLFLLVTGCGTVGAGSNPATVTITANPTTVAAGGTSTLTVTATNATGVTVAGSDGSSKTMAAAGGTLTVTPTNTTTYTATATGSGGNATATATVTVGSGTAPTVTIAASPTSIAAGGSSTLTVTATNATGVTVTGSDGSSYTLSGTGGTQSVSPKATTTYTATATGAGGNATATATVTVGSGTAPTVTIAANPTTITVGSNSTLTVAATNATGVVVTGSDGTTSTLAPTGGTVTVSPAATTTYTATATGAAGTTPATATATVTVVPAPPPVAPTVTLSANPTTIVAPGSTTLTVVATNATTLLLQGTDNTSFSSPANFPATGGMETVTPSQNATYTATATGPGGTATASVFVTVTPTPKLAITANPQSITSGNSSTLTVTTTNVTNVVITGTDGSNYPVADTGGTQSVSPTTTTTYTVNANSPAGPMPPASATVTVVPPGTVDSINHVIFMLQENHAFDNYFGMLNPYRSSKGWDMGTDGTPYTVDGIDDKWNTSYLAGPGKGVTRSISNNDQQGTAHTLYKFKSTCVDDMSSAWTESYGDVSLGDYVADTRGIRMNGFVSNADGFANSKCPGGVGPCTSYTDIRGDRAMGYYDEGFLNYYYYMASQFALSDRWFSPVSSKSIPNRIATFTGGTTQGVTQDPGQDDHFPQLQINTIFQELDKAKVSWKIYYLANNGQCDPTTCQPSGVQAMPATTFSSLGYSYNFVNSAKPCGGNLQPSTVVGDTTNSFCIDPTHIAPLKDKTHGYLADLNNGTLPSFAFIESGSGFDDEHPGYQQSILDGQRDVATIINELMTSTSWKDSVFFFAYDEGGGPYDHVPPVPTHTNDWTTNTAVADYPTDISTIAVNADSYKPCAPTSPPGAAPPYCDLKPGAPGTNSTDDPAVNGFAAQLGFRVPNFVISPFAKKHYVSHVPMDHTAIIKFVENRFIDNDTIGHGSTHLTARDAAQPNLLDFFDFSSTGPWNTPPSPPTPTPKGSSCTPDQMK
ncbi:MAG: phospholipase [Acidobacteriaceae bacterium]|nr:phospholipase [Acidobacteriaceae bacterium]